MNLPVTKLRFGLEAVLVQQQPGGPLLWEAGLAERFLSPSWRTMLERGLCCWFRACRERSGPQLFRANGLPVSRD